MSPLNPHLLRHLAAVRAERDRQARQVVDEAARGSVDEARARSLLHPKPRLEALGTVKEPPA